MLEVPSLQPISTGIACMAIIAIVSWISQSNILYIYNKIMKVDFLKKSKKTNKK